MEWYIRVLENYADFEGRAHRTEYWMFILINTFVGIGINLLEWTLATGGIIGLLYTLAVLIPSVAVSVRRLHDIGRSGWWLLISLIPLLGVIVILVFHCLESEPGDNDYGPDPKRA